MNLLDYLGRPICYHRCFRTVTGSVAAALMLSQANYWRGKTKDPDGWFWKTQEEWEEETGLSRKNQDTARSILRNLGFMEERLSGLPARLYFRINAEKLVEALANQVIPKEASLYDRKEQACLPVSDKLPIYSSESTTKSTSKSRFTPPSEQECIEYGESIGVSKENASHYFDSKNENGWVQGKAHHPIKCWKAGLRNWKRQSASFATGDALKAQTPSYRTQGTKGPHTPSQSPKNSIHLNELKVLLEQWDQFPPTKIDMRDVERFRLAIKERGIEEIEALVDGAGAFDGWWGRYMTEAQIQEKVEGESK